MLSTTFNTATKTNGWGYKQGTSMAGPHAAGVAALALSAHPGLKPGALASFLERTADVAAVPGGRVQPGPRCPATRRPAPVATRNGFYGAGNVNAYNAVQ